MTIEKRHPSRLVAHHVGARGFGVSLNVPDLFRKDIVHVLFEADQDCVDRMLGNAETAHAKMLSEKLVFPYCVGRRRASARLNITANSYASSLYPPNPEFMKYTCEIPIDAAIYDVTYRDMLEVVREVEVEIHSIDELLAEGRIPEWAWPDFLSVDTQGFELEILEGAKRAMSESVLGVVSEVEMLPMYQGQPLFSDILGHMTRSGFIFAGLTAQFDVSPHRVPIGLRARGFPGFGDALFLRDERTLTEERFGANRLYVMLNKLAFIAVCFELIEYALQVIDRIRQLRPRVDDEVLSMLKESEYSKFLGDLETAAKYQAERYPPIHAVPNDARVSGDTRTSWYDRHHKRALKRAAFRLLPQKALRAVRKLLDRPFFSNYTAFETILVNSGFTEATKLVRQRRVRAEAYVKALSPEMVRDGALAHLPRT